MSDAMSDPNFPYEIGKYYLFRTVTMIDTGELVAVCDKEIVLKNAAWVADTGRFTDALAKCEFSEVEMFPKNKLVFIGRGSIIDVVELEKLPTTQK